MRHLRENFSIKATQALNPQNEKAQWELWWAPLENSSAKNRLQQVVGSIVDCGGPELKFDFIPTENP